MTLTMTDLFCGAGGSSTGAVQVPGVEVKLAANHWDLAIETHNANHPNVDHLQADISQTDPRYIAGTDLLWASPECTNHSRAKGKKKIYQADLFGDTLPDEAAMRSRATMWDVVRFTEAHMYRAVIVENVVEVVDWAPDGAPIGVLFDSWLRTMLSMGYEHQIVSMNSMHAQAQGLPAPQSRDRVYIVFNRATDTRPDLNAMQRPKAYCPTCDQVVESVQSWKKVTPRPGKYRTQYVYRCPNASCRNAIVEPSWLPASSIIDWSLPGTRIGDRDKPLADKTMRRIQVGIDRYWSDGISLEQGGNGYDAADPKHAQFGNPDSYYRAWPLTEPLKTMHTRESKAIAYDPLMVPVEGRDGKQAASMLYPLRTMTTRSESAVAMPPYMVEMRGGGSTARLASDALSTVSAGGNHHALITSYYGASDGAQPVSQTLPTVTTSDRHALIQRGRTVNVEDVRFRMLEPAEIKQAMAFPADYVMCGNRREQVKLSGNAVTPPAARDLISAVVTAITGGA